MNKYNEPLSKEVPLELRLDIYKKALHFVSNYGNIELPGRLIYPELCLLLPVILYNFDHYSSMFGNADFSHKKTKIAFPELNKKFFSEIESYPSNSCLEESNIVRKRYLQYWITEIENKLRKNLLPYNGVMDESLPLDVKIEVFKKSLDVIYSKTWSKYKLAGPWLCLLFPCVLWDLESYIQNRVHTWTTSDTKTAFEELDDVVIASIENAETSNAAINLRIEYIKTWIVNLENKKKYE